jgi:predicted adenylyl cyclase CyaB
MGTEIEIRAFVTDEQYKKLADFLTKNAEFVSDDKQETHYLSGDNDLRIQKNNRYAKIWMKKGKIHDDEREEIEIKTGKEDFEELKKLFLELGYITEIKWFRTRKEYKWEDITVCLDDTRGYGKIIELEKITEGDDKEVTLDYLKNKLAELNVPLTPKEEFNRKYAHYKQNWKTLTEK